MNCIEIEVFCAVEALPVKHERIKICRYFNFTGRQYPLGSCKIDHFFNRYPLTAAGIHFNDVRPQISDIRTESNLSGLRLNSEGNLQLLAHVTGKIDHIAIPCLCSTSSKEAFSAFKSTILNDLESLTCTGSTLKLAIFEVVIERICILRRLDIICRLLNFSALLGKNYTIKGKFLRKVTTEKNRCLRGTPGSCVSKTPDRNALDLISFALCLQKLFEQSIEIYALIVLLIERGNKDVFQSFFRCVRHL